MAEQPGDDAQALAAADRDRRAARHSSRRTRPRGRARPRRGPARRVSPATVTPGHLALIETMWRMVYVLATLNRERMIDARRETELDDIVAAAHRLMAETMNEDAA